VTSFRPRHFVQMASDKPFTTTRGYGCSEAVLFWAKHAPNSENESSEDREVDNRSSFC